MKKLAIFLLCIMMVGMLAIPAFAADSTEITISANTTTVAPGETVTFVVSIKGHTEAKSIGVKLQYDTTKFELVSGEITTTMDALVKSFNPKTGFAIQLSAPAVPEGEIGRFTLKAISQCPATVSVNGTPSIKNGTTPVDATVKGTTVTITGSHTWDDGVQTKAPGCETTGTTTYTCSVCDATKTSDIEALGHNYDAGVETEAATCSAEGTKTYTCQNDRSHTKTEKIEKLPHTENAGEITTEPTCTVDGVKTFICSVCKEELRTEAVSAIGHAYDNGVTTTEPTCTVDGVKTFTCQNDPSHTKTESIPRIGHKYDDGVVTTQPGCETKGVKTYTCQNDKSHTYTEDVSATGHDYNDGEVTTEPGCVTTGVMTYTCRKDASHTYTEEIEAVGHTPSEDTEITKEPTCTETGLMTGSCAVCQTPLNNEVIPELGHDYKLDEENSVAPTCTEKGSNVYVCQNDSTHTYAEDVAALGHDFDGWVMNDEETHKHTCKTCGEDEKEAHKWNSGMVTKAPTCTETGVKTYTCTVAGCNHTKTEELPVTDHEYNDKFVDNEDDKTHDAFCACGAVDEDVEHTLKEVVVKESTTTVKGSAKKICEDCGYETAEYELPLKTNNYDKVPATGDITNQIVIIAVSMFVMFAAFAAVIIKRKFVK